MCIWYKVFLISVVVVNYSLNMELEESDPSKYTFFELGKYTRGPYTSRSYSIHRGRRFFGCFLAVRRNHQYQPIYTLPAYKIGRAIDPQCETNECIQEGESFLNDWYNFSLRAKQNNY